MSTEQAIWRKSYKAAEDLSSYQYCFVMLDSTAGRVRLPNAEDEVADGILQNAPASGEPAEVMQIGESKLKTNAALVIGKLVKHEYVSASDCGKGQDAGTWWDGARGIVTEASSAEDDLCTVKLIGPFPRTKGGRVSQVTVASITTADDVTLTAAQLLGGFIDRDPAGGARTDTLPTAALMIAALNQGGVGNAIEFTIKNSADAAETITVAAGTGGTAKGTMTIAQNNSKRFILIVTGSTTYDVYSLGTVVH